MSWRVTLESIAGNERFLSAVLSELGLTLAKLDDKWHLTGQMLKSCSDARDALYRVVRVAEKISDFVQLNPSVQLAFTPSITVIEETTQGSLRQYILQPASRQMGAALSCIIVDGSATAEPMAQGDLERQQVEREKQAFRDAVGHACRRIQPLLLPEKSDEAAKVQRLLAKDLTPHVIGQLYDIFTHGGGPRPKCRPGTDDDLQWKRLNFSIQEPRHMGDMARHGVSQIPNIDYKTLHPKDPRRNPMSLPEAQAFISEAAERWLEDIRQEQIRNSCL